MDEEVIWRTITVIVAVSGFIFALFLLWACCKVASRCSRDEERRWARWEEEGRGRRED